MKCNKCGAELEEGAVFCGACGAKIEQPAEQPAETAALSEPEAEPEAVIETVTAPAANESVPEAVPVQPAAQPFRPEPVVQTVSRQTEDDGLPVSLGTWVCRHLITFIPCVGWLIYIIMLFVWAFDKKYNSTSRNWAKAELIFMAIAVILVIVIMAVMAGIFAVNGMDYNNNAPNPYFDYFEMY